jgi:geranylgeranyl pyrophosphate synthase
MKTMLNNLLERHLNYEKETIHLITVLFGITSPKKLLPHSLEISKCMELMKASTLIMDDFLDHSLTRNEIPSIYAQFGPEVAVLLAEILKTSATMKLCEALSSASIRECDKNKCLFLFEDTYRTVCLGQLEEIEMTKGLILSRIKEKDYWEMIMKTTAVFIQMPLLFGSIINQYEKPTEDALRAYGLKIGLAYQVRDDVLDIIGDPSITGKQLGGDIKEHKVRLPIIHSFAVGSRKIKNRIKEVYDKKIVNNKDVETIIEILKQTGSIKFCSDKAARLCSDAKKIINSSIKDQRIKKQLTDISDLVEHIDLNIMYKEVNCHGTVFCR